MRNITAIPIFLLILVAACRSAQEWPPQPVAIHLSEDACFRCKMMITQENYGAQLHEKGKAVQLFDDVGCLTAGSNPAQSSARVVYVRDANDGQWLLADRATYVTSKQIPSPMGYGIAAFAAKESATAFAERFDGSRMVSLSGLMERTEKIPGAGSEKRE